MVTSFPSKSELALNLSTDHNYLTFMVTSRLSTRSTYPIPTLPQPSIRLTRSRKFFRAVAQVDEKGKFKFTKTNAYSGNNGRAAILNNSSGGFSLHCGQRRQRRQS